MITPMSLRWNAKEWREIYTEVGAYSIFAHISPDAQARNRGALILIHGLSMSGTYMLPMGAELMSEWKIYIPDLPGFGRSNKPSRPLQISELADTLAQWMDLQAIEQASFVGNSFGCQIIVDFALRYRERVVAAILVGPTVDPGGRSILQQIGRAAIDGLLYESWSLWPIILRDYARTGFWRTWQTLQILLADPIEVKLTQVGTPILIVRGANDVIVPQHWAERAAYLLPKGQLSVLPDAAHAINYSDPLRLSSIIHSFLS